MVSVVIPLVILFAAGPVPVPRGQHQLLFDDFIIEEMHGFTRTLHQPQKYPVNPVLRREHPWEGFRVQVYGTVLYDPGEQLFKAWYMNIPATAAEKIVVQGQRRPGHATLLSYATSKDGIAWDKPVLNLVDFEGSTANNMIAPDLYNPEGFSALNEPHDPDPARRYKAFYWDHGRGPLMMWEGQEIYGEGKDDGMHVAFSPDGIHWTPHEGNPVLRIGSDSGQTVLYDPRLKKYVAFSRLGFGRKVARTESDDFIHWSPPELVLKPDARDGADTQFYGITVSLYEGVYVGALWMFYVQEKSVGRIDFQFCWSRDGRQWQRDPERRVFVGNGPQGSWDHGDIRGASHFTVLDEEIRLYYAGSEADHGRGAELGKGMDIGFATLRRDGFMSLDAGADVGTLLTKSLTYSGGNLYLNLDATRGEARVTVIDAVSGKEVKQEVLRGDTPRALVTLPALEPGKALKLRVDLKDAALYSFWFE